MSRNSSSPDVLAPPGDAEYLISSPVKPFSGRQSFMSPANFRPLHTPRKRQRVTLSPEKTSHSVQFDDILLPGSPTMKLNGQPRSPSPDKFQADGSVSPWKIRLTLEATQDENNQRSPGRKRRGSPTKTTKVPLKDEQDHTTQTPRRRGRPRRSDVQRDMTPIVGSPGHTPGPGGTGQKRKRGRPRKSVPESAVPQDTQVHAQMPSVEPEQARGPLNIAADGDFEYGLPDNYPDDPFLDQVVDQRDGVSGGSIRDESPPRMSFDTPDVGAIDREDMEDEQYLHSTPSKMPSPDTASYVPSPENTLHAGHTPRRRSYPTPTSSQVGEDAEQTETDGPGNGFNLGAHHSDDPVDDHRGLDSIVESEEFSMVSLDALPSAKQHGLNGNEKLTKGPLKPFLEHEYIGSTDRKKYRAPTAHNDRDHLSPTPRLRDHRSPRLQSLSPGRQAQPLGSDATFTDNVPAVVVGPPSTRRSFRLARIVRVGIVLAGTLKNQLGKVTSREASASDIEDSRKRLEVAFGGYHPETERVLQAGLGLGQELAKRFSQAEAEKTRQTADAEIAELTDPREKSEARRPHQEQVGAVQDDDVSSEMKRRMAEWQDEREAVSREIETANSSQVIIIDSDDPEGPEGDYGHGALNEEGVEPGLEPVPEQEPGLDPNQREQDFSDEGSVDIWQEEARDYDPVSHQPSKSRHPENERQLHASHASSLKSSSGSVQSDANFPAGWARDNNTVPYLGQSRVRLLREQEVDLSPLFREEYTPRRYHYYYGKSTPASSGKKRRQSSGLSREVEEPVHQLDAKSGPNGDASGQSNLRGYEGNDLDLEQRVEDEEEVPGAPAAGHSIHEDPNTTPGPSRQTNPDIQGSSWFQRLTSFTPRWLKAPKDKPNAISENEEDQPVSPEAIDVVTDTEDGPDPEPQASPGPERQPKRLNPTQQTPPDPNTTHKQSKGKAKGPSAAEATQRLLNRKPAEKTSPFSDAHYAALRRLFRHLRRDRDAFPYYPLPGRSEMIGDWFTTSDRAYTLQITKEQFAIVDQFILELENPDTDLADGGWDEADLHRRLVSVIIGEHIRNERKHGRRGTGIPHDIFGVGWNEESIIDGTARIT